MNQPIYDEDDYLGLIQELLPQGAAFPRASDSVQTATLRGFALSQSTNQLTQSNLLVDAFPSTTVNLLPEWEKSLDLPDPCLGFTPTLAQRQNAVVAKLVAAGGQSIPYLISVCVALGFPGVTFTEFAPYTFGEPFGLPMVGEAWAYALMVNNVQFNIEYFLFGHDTMGTPFAHWSNNELICTLRRIVPAHVILLFAFS